VDGFQGYFDPITKRTIPLQAIGNKLPECHFAWFLGCAEMRSTGRQRYAFNIETPDLS
jgi:hypothetical protein